MLTRYQKAVITLVVVIFILFTYEQLLHLVFLSLEVLFESIEYALDLMIEQLFATGTHETQVIVFYILVPAILIGSYLLISRVLSNTCQKVRQSLHQQKTQVLTQWQTLSLMRKMALWCFLISVVSSGLFLSLM